MTGNTANPTILITDESRIFRTALENSITEKLGFRVLTASNFVEALEHISTEAENIFLAVLDYNLPDAPNGEVIDFALEQHVPCLVFSSEIDEMMREELSHKDVVDYIVKNVPSSVETVVNVIRRFHQNQFLKALVVDDSRVARSIMRKYLEIFNFQVMEAAGGESALEQVAAHPDIKLVLTDFNMPDMNGVDLVTKLRETHSRNKMAIMGISGQGNNVMSSAFLKSGANDFLVKPFLKEELFCRVTQNIDYVEHIEALESTLVTDYLTGLRNRGYLFTRGNIIHNEAVEKDATCATAIIDVQQLRQLNTDWGHEAGDEALKLVARALEARFSTYGVTARLGGTEFVVVMLTTDPAAFQTEINGVLDDIAQRRLSWAGETLTVEVAAGCCIEKTASLDDSLAKAEADLKANIEDGQQIRAR